MDRTSLAGLAGVLVALSPAFAAAQSSAPAGPVIADASQPAPRFGFLAGPSKSDVAWSTNGDELVQRIELQDPADQLSTGVAAEIAKRKGGSVVGGGRADYTVTVGTMEWSAGYYVPSRPTYNVKYAAQLAITDGSGTVVKTATCQVMPDDRESAGSNDEFVAHKVRTLKTMMAKAAADCLRTLVSKTKSL